MNNNEVMWVLTGCCWIIQLSNIGPILFLLFCCLIENDKVLGVVFNDKINSVSRGVPTEVKADNIMNINVGTNNSVASLMVLSHLKKCPMRRKEV